MFPLPGGREVARISADNGGVVAGDVAGGLDVVFGGVEVFEVRAREAMGWRKAAPAAGLAILLLACVGAWTRGGHGELSTVEINECIALTVFSALYAVWGVRPMGVVWRFDHKRKSIARRHFLWGMSRQWNSGRATGIEVRHGKDTLGRDKVSVEILGGEGRSLAEIGSWDRARVDLRQIEMGVGEIKKVMWWR
jgi:hypothetical protein